MRVCIAFSSPFYMSYILSALGNLPRSRRQSGLPLPLPPEMTRKENQAQERNKGTKTEHRDLTTPSPTFVCTVMGILELCGVVLSLSTDNSDGLEMFTIATGLLPKARGWLVFGATKIASTGYLCIAWGVLECRR